MNPQRSTGPFATIVCLNFCTFLFNKNINMTSYNSSTGSFIATKSQIHNMEERLLEISNLDFPEGLRYTWNMRTSLIM